MLADDQAHYVISKLSTIQTRVSTKGATYKITTECKSVPTYS